MPFCLCDSSQILNTDRGGWIPKHSFLSLDRLVCCENWYDIFENMWPRLSQGRNSICVAYWMKLICICYFFFFLLFRAAPVAYGSSQARGWIGAAAGSLCHSHSNVGSELCLWPHGDAGSLSHWARPGVEHAFSWYSWVHSTEPQWELLYMLLFENV